VLIVRNPIAARKPVIKAKSSIASINTVGSVFSLRFLERVETRISRRFDGVVYGVEEDLVVKRLGEKGGRTILPGQASDGVLVVRRNDDDARLRRNRAKLLLEFKTAQPWHPDID
jgi:hypothetical protein